MIYLCLPPGFNSIWDSSRIHLNSQYFVVDSLWVTFFSLSHFLWWPVSCNSLHQNAWDLPSYIPCGISTHYISRTGDWESFSQFTLALKSLGQHTHTLDSALVSSHWARHVRTPGKLIFTSLFVYLHLSFSSKIRNCFTCMMQTKGQKRSRCACLCKPACFLLS